MSKIDHSRLTKLYYSIGEVADMLDVNTSLMRFWEKEFSTIKPKKNKKGNRLYTVKEIQKIDNRKCLKCGLDASTSKIVSDNFNPYFDDVHCAIQELCLDCERAS